MVKGWRIRAITEEGNIILKTNLKKDKRVDIRILEKDPHIVEFWYKKIPEMESILEAKLTEELETQMLRGIQQAMLPCKMNIDYRAVVLI